MTLLIIGSSSYHRFITKSSSSVRSRCPCALDQAVTIEASGPDGPLLIELVAVEAALDGTWSMSEQSGTFAATRAN